MAASSTPTLDRLLQDTGTSLNKDEARKLVLRLALEASANGSWHYCPSVLRISSTLKLPPGKRGKRVHFAEGTDIARKRTKYGHVTKQPEIVQAAPISPSLVPPLPAPLAPTNSLPPTIDELAFFDRVRKHLANKSQYVEFLKLVNIYTQDLCSAQWLAFRGQSFIGNNPELYSYFKTFIGAEPEDEVIDNQPVQPTGRVALSHCRGLGPSYRLLPKSDMNKPCAGRDDLCRSVLNDEWASHPTWASEDSGFVAHRKNQFEEGLHRIEEERHDYDSNLGALDRTIQLLEPIAQSLSVAAPEVRKNFQLSTTLGGQSETIYKRPIIKIYGRQQGNNVIQMLFKEPYEVVGPLLNRLKTKREEWLASQREWNKVWRGSTNSMFWKSLDHQGAGARQADKRQFSSKNLQAEVMVRDEEHKRQRENLAQHVPDFLLEFKFDDPAVLYECITLILVHIEHRSEPTEATRLSPFIKEFVATFFGLDQNNMRTSFKDDESPAEYADEDSAMAEGGVSPRQKPNGKRTESLLRGVLERGRAGKPGPRDEDSVASDSRASTPEPMSVADEEATGALESPPASEQLNESLGVSGEKWLDYPVEKNLLDGEPVTVQEPYGRKSFNMYVNWQLYYVFRLLATFYERLSHLKAAESNVHNIISRALMPMAADQLGWRDRTPASFFANTGYGANYYQQMLVKFEELVEDPTPERSAEVEETLRRHYLHVGWQLYNCDKLVSSIVKQIAGVVAGDSKENSMNIYQAFKKDRQREETTHQDEVSYRKQVEKFAKDSDVLRIAFDTESKIARVKMLHKHDATFGAAKTYKERWQAYIASFVRIEPTEGFDHAGIAFPFLRRNAEVSDNLLMSKLWNQISSDEKVTLRIDPKSYKIAIDPDGYDWMVRKKVARLDYDRELWATISEESESKSEVVLERLVMNNEWMKGLTKDEVDAAKTEYADAVKFDGGVDATTSFDFNALPGWKDLIAVPVTVVESDEEMEGVEE